MNEGPDNAAPQDELTQQGDVTETSREASVRLRSGEGGEAALMDPANQSLADALRITFMLLQVAMVVLAGLFVFSGFQTVREGERGISVLFGRAVGTNLEPGFHFAAPYPFGELVKVGTGNVTPRLLTQFWPAVAPGSEEDSIDLLPARSQLNPERDGSLITADLNLAHTQWQAVYRRVDPVDYVRNIYAPDETEIVEAALERGVVRAIGTTTIDDLLKPQEGGVRDIAERAREIAQETLNALDAGIQIEQFELSRRTPPANLLSKFRAVLDARSAAQKSITDARALRDQSMNAAAGEASAALLYLIDEYEVAVETRDAERASSVLSRIDAILAGEPVSFGEDELARVDDPGLRQALESSNGRMASGNVVTLIQNAAVDSTSAVQEARGELDHFRAKLEQFRANPRLMVRRDWASAWSAFQERDFVQTMLLPVGQAAELWINEDPDIVKELDRAQKAREVREAAEQRDRESRAAQFRGERGLPVEDE